MVRSFPACCATAASGHAAPPPSSVMNLRRLMSNTGPALSAVGLPHDQPTTDPMPGPGAALNCSQSRLPVLAVNALAAGRPEGLCLGPPAPRRQVIGTFGPGTVYGRRHQRGEFGLDLSQLGQDGRSLRIVQGPLAQHGTLVMRIEKAAMFGRVRPSDRGKAGRAGLNVLAVDVGARLTPLGRKLKASNAFRPRKQPCLRGPGHITGDLEQLHQVGDLIDLVDLTFHQRNALCGLAGENRNPFVSRSYRHLVGQLVTLRSRLSARLLRSAA
jgi:hypothetical protein